MLRRIEEIDHRIEEMAKDQGRPAAKMFSSRPPFTDNVMNAPAPRGFKMPTVPQYDGTTDPVDHLVTFRTMMLLHGASYGFPCRAFPTTLTGAARGWYSKIKPNSISNFEDFGDDLVCHFMSSRRPRKITASLMALRQEDNEPLKTFVSCFNMEALQVPNLDLSATMNALLAGTKFNDFRRSVARQNLHSLADLMAGAEEYIVVEETLAALDSNRRRTFEEKNPTKQRRDDKASKRERDHGYDTNECWQLKKEIELLINRGYLKKFVKDDGHRGERREKSLQGQSPRRSQPPPARNQSPLPSSSQPEMRQSQPNGVINTIMGGPAAGGTSSAARKAYSHRVNAGHTCSKKVNTGNEISFSNANLDNLILPHDNALVITMLVANWELMKILVDNGSSADILYYHAFKQMMIGDDRLKPANSDLFCFSGEIVKVEGQIELPVLIGEPPCQAFAMVNFLNLIGAVT
ncbi:uncharacterized protein LOC143847913 [Tasmannia lanceolata]|uniref:uncharacterized protein LOC143847913 n=1 Tax=Tasmannia lanceolata TaxID=3420 RepID=UPI004062D97C